jgi:hypothetical protein
MSGVGHGKEAHDRRLTLNMEQAISKAGSGLL